MPVARVVYGMVDPNPLVSGQGLTRLQAAGIEVIGPCLEAEAQQLNRGFIKRMRDGRPFVTCKLAMSWMAARLWPAVRVSGLPARPRGRMYSVCAPAAARLLPA